MFIPHHEVSFQILFCSFKLLVPFTVLYFLELFVKLIFCFVIQIAVSFLSSNLQLFSFSRTFETSDDFLVLVSFNELFEQEIRS